MRLLGFLGILPLGLINILGFIHSIKELDFKGIALMSFMAVLLTLFAVTLWKGAKLERGSIQGKLAEGWESESVSSFFRNIVTKSLEGRIYITGAIVSAVVALLGQVWPESVGVSSGNYGHAILFGLWPIVSFVLYIHICGPSYKSSVTKVLLTFAIAAFPFYVAYS